MESSEHFFTHKKPIVDRFFVLSTTLALAVATPPLAIAQALTADDVVRLALSRSENAAVIAADLEAARGAQVAARTWRNPVIELEREGTDGFRGEGYETFVRLERTFDVSGRRRLERQAADARVSAAEFGRTDAEAILRAEALSRFYDVLAADLRVAVAERHQYEAVALHDATAARQREGDASRYDLERVRQETALAPVMLAETRAEAFAARRALGALIGAEMREVRATVAGVLAPPETEPAEALLLRAQRTPRLQALAAEADASQLRSRAADRIAPDVTLGGGVRSVGGGMADETGLIVSFSVPLPLFDRNQGERLSRAAEASRATARYRLARDQIAADVAALAYRTKALREVALDYDQGARAASEEFLRISGSAYAGGEITVLEAIDALRAVRDTELRAIQLQRNARAAHTALYTLVPENTP